MSTSHEQLLSKLPSELHPLVNRSTPFSLQPKKAFNSSLTSVIKSQSQLPPSAIPALHLLNSDWNSAHLIAQDNEGVEGGLFDYMHGLVHVFEGDCTNARYWFSPAPTNPPTPLKYHPFLRIAHPSSSPDPNKPLAAAREFVNECEKAADLPEGDEHKIKVEQQMLDEVKELLGWCLENGEKS